MGQSIEPRRSDSDLLFKFMIKIIKNLNSRFTVRNSSGFSLVELLVSVSVFLIFVIALNGTMGTVNKATKNSANRERATVLA